MDRVEALERINDAWNSSDLTLGEKINEISNDFYAVGLDLDSTAAFIKATPAELDALLSLSSLDDELIEMISIANPPKTTWTLFASASDEEIKQAINALEHINDVQDKDNVSSPVSEFIYQKMLDVSGPTTEQRVGMLSGLELGHALKKAKDFDVLSPWENKFFKSIVAQKRRGKTLSTKQINSLISVLNNLASRGVIKRDSIDGDEDVCNRILDAIGK